MGDDISPELDGDASKMADFVGLSHPVILCRMQLVEAELARAKLDSEGIASFVRDANTAIANPFIVSEVPLMVGKEDVERAREILARPATDDAEGEYVDEAWRCPKCHRKTVDILPLSPWLRMLRNIWFLILFAPVIVFLIESILGRHDFPDNLPNHSVPIWALASVGVGSIIAILPRTKRCHECRYEWSGAKAKSDDAD